MSYGTDVAQEAHDLLCTLARIPAPSHDEGRRAEFVRDWLIGQGLDAEIDDALNVTSSYGVGIIGRIALFSAHTDVVFPDTVPLPLVEQDGRIQAPGVGDDTANLVCLLLAYRELLRRNLRDLKIVGITDEGLKDILRFYYRLGLPAKIFSLQPEEEQQEQQPQE